jgi:hypothetical protein
MATRAVAVTHRLENSPRAEREAQAMQNNENQKGITLEVSDDGLAPQYVVYVYNVLELQHVREMPPNFSHFVIPPCVKGEKVSYTQLPAFVRNKFNKFGSFEYYYKREDGRKSAGQLLNPGSFPSIDWDRQLYQNNPQMNDQQGNNLNNFGCWWSLTKPDDPKLDQEIATFTARARATMNDLIRQANMLEASVNTQGHSRKGEISPMMHFAADYLHVRAGWHTSHEHTVSCPTCGEPVVAGLAYHRNSFGDRCIIDKERCEALGIGVVREVREIVEPAPSEPLVEGETEAEEPSKMDEDTILKMAKRIRQVREATAKENQRKARVANAAKIAAAAAFARSNKPDPDAT